jgi:hypothetical protein
MRFDYEENKNNWVYRGKYLNEILQVELKDVFKKDVEIKAD